MSDIAVQWVLKPRIIQIMCAKGKIEGATKVGNVWLLPENSEKPLDLRIKLGKYIKKRTVRRMNNAKGEIVFGISKKI